MEKVYELTTNENGGFEKYFVRGIKNDAEARRVAKKGFGERYYWKNGISYYDNYPSKYGNDWSNAPTVSEFIALAKKRFTWGN